jgi:hypothetical protein
MAWRVQALILVNTRQRTPLERNRFENAVAISRQDGFEAWEAATFVLFRRIIIDTVREVSWTWVINSALVLPRIKERQLATDFRDRTMTVNKYIPHPHTVETRYHTYIRPCKRTRH